MSPRSKRKYLEKIVQRYRAASYTITTAIQNEFYSACGHHRKHALRLLSGFKHFPSSDKPADLCDKVYWLISPFVVPPQADIAY